MTKEKEYYIKRKKLNGEWVWILIGGIIVFLLASFIIVGLGIEKYSLFTSIGGLICSFILFYMSIISFVEIGSTGETEKYKEVEEKIKVKEVKNGGKYSKAKKE